MTALPPDPAAVGTPGAALAHAWALLAHGLAGRASPMRTPVLATVTADGAPAARTVILRAADPAAWTVAVFTDARSPKVAEAARDPRVAIVAYEPAVGVQVRLDGRARLLRGEAAAAAWEAAPAPSLAVYRAEPGPGTPLARPEDAGLRPPRGPRDGFERFVVLHVAVEAVDWLHLDPAGHRRMRAVRRDGRTVAGWVAP